MLENVRWLHSTSFVLCSIRDTPGLTPSTEHSNVSPWNLRSRRKKVTTISQFTVIRVVRLVAREKTQPQPSCYSYSNVARISQLVLAWTCTKWFTLESREVVTVYFDRGKILPSLVNFLRSVGGKSDVAAHGGVLYCLKSSNILVKTRQHGILFAPFIRGIARKERIYGDQCFNEMSLGLSSNFFALRKVTKYLL